MNIILIGIQGCGKGTAIAGLEKHFKLTLVSMGKLLRDEIATGSELGKTIKEIIDRGELAPFDIIESTLRKKLKNSFGDLTVFDGFPRNKEQAELLDSVTKIDKVIHLNLSKEVAIDRILNRLTCSSCAYITKKQLVLNDTCPQCGGKLVSRSDDTIEGINKRFEIYEKETYPLLQMYKENGVEVIDVDASRTPDEVLEDILKVINNEHKI